MESLEILYQDRYIVAVNKPSGMLVHKTKIADDVREGFALQTLRDQLKQYVYPLHRIDRPTSGVLLFALSSEIAGQMKKIFDAHALEKQYLAICRGYLPSSHKEEKPLRVEGKQNYQESTTLFECLAQKEIDLPNGRYKKTRFSLIKAFPLSGRMHQIRRHLKYMSHPIIGDTTYGDLKLNNQVNSRLNHTHLCLHAHKVAFTHPVFHHKTVITAKHISSHFEALSLHLGLEKPLSGTLAL